MSLYDVGYEHYGGMRFEGDNDTSWVFWIIIMIIVIILYLYWTRDDQSAKKTVSVEELGRASWKLLHATADKYPVQANDEHERSCREYLQLFARMYPCEKCSAHMTAYLRKYPPQTGSRRALQMWMCTFHNSVNAKLGKKAFPCTYGSFDCDKETCSSSRS